MSGPTGGDRIAVSIVTGFLGSGKTTLIAALLRQPAMEGTAVIVNEFGEVGIDDAIIADATDNRVLFLKNGCLCCVAGDDLTQTIWSLATRDEGRPRQILIETSGLADPVPLLQRLMGDLRLKQTIRLDAVVATVDAVHGVRNLDDQPVAANQSAVADRRLITKTDIADPATVAALTERLMALNPGAEIRTVSHGVIDAADLFGLSLYDPKKGQAQVHRWLDVEHYRAQMTHTHETGHGHHDHGSAAVSVSTGDAVRTWLIESDKPIDWDTVRARIGDVINHHGESLLRMKGILWTAGDPRPLVIHGVQRLFHSPVRIERWPGPPRTSIVVIGTENAQGAVTLLADALIAEPIHAS
jgi:G3E family GTPase